MATVYVGTYTERLDHVDGRGEGIYVYAFEDGRLRLLSIARGLANPSFISVGQPAGRLYAVSEVLEFRGQPGGAVQAWSINPDTCELTAINCQKTPGGAPCYVAVAGRTALVANYMGGSVTAVALNRDGSLGAVTSHIQHVGFGPDPVRQEAPHPHAILPAGDLALVPDLGTDQVYAYRLRGTLEQINSPVHVQAGAGPRHVAVNHLQTRAYVINELDSTITVIALEADRMRVLQTLDALPPRYDGVRSGADIWIHPNGRFVYASLRGPGSLVRLIVETSTGHLSDPVWVPTHGLTPRSFALDAVGRHLIVANQDSDTLVVFGLDPASGRLSDPLQTVAVPSPACVRIAD